MTVEIRDDVTTIIDKNANKHEPIILIWTIGEKSVETSDIDNALEKIYPELYKELRK